MSIKVQGIKKYQPRKVDLSRFFDEPRSVTVRALPPASRAEIQEITTDGVRYATKQRKRSLDVEAIEQSMPKEVTLAVREIKLRDGFVSTDIAAKDDQGKDVPWGHDLWAVLDEENPQILEAVLEAINEETYPDEEGDGADPTSPAATGRR